MSLRKDRLNLSKNFALYYGYGKLDELSRFDVAILEAKGQTPEEIAKMKEKNTLMLMYISVLEVHPNDPIYRKLKDKDFLHVDGKPVKNEEFGTYLVNLKSKTWIAHLLRDSKYKIERLGADGLFIDTIGSIEMFWIPEEMKQQQLLAFTNFLYTLKLLYPAYLFVQNSGVEEVCKYTNPYIDGICWENPPFAINGSEAWCEWIVDRLHTYQQEQDVRVFFLYDKETDRRKKSYPIARKLAKTHNFLLYVATSNYVSGVNPLKG